MRKVLSTILVGIIVFQQIQAQDIHFSQFYNAPLQLNPGSAGAQSDVRAILNYKEQWRSVASPYKTFAGSFDGRFSRSKYGYWGAGVFLYSDRAGDSKMGVAQGNLNLAYHLNIARGQTLGLGLMGGYAQRSVNTMNMQWGNQYNGTSFDASLPSNEVGMGNFTNSFFDLGTGLVYTFSREESNMTGNDQIHAIVGLSVFHAHKPDYSFLENGEDRLARKYVFHGSSVFGIPHSRLSVIPGFQYKIQGGARELVLGSQLRYQVIDDSKITGFVPGMELYFGAYYRVRDAVILTTTVQYGGFGVGISYDLNVSDLTRASSGRGGLELALSYKLPQSDLWKRHNARFY